jgi:two-component system KDP operon response regulator KdpE
MAGEEVGAGVGEGVDVEPGVEPGLGVCVEGLDLGVRFGFFVFVECDFDSGWACGSPTRARQRATPTGAGGQAAVIAVIAVTAAGATATAVGVPALGIPQAEMASVSNDAATAARTSPDRLIAEAPSLPQRRSATDKTCDSPDTCAATVRCGDRGDQSTARRRAGLSAAHNGGVDGPPDQAPRVLIVEDDRALRAVLVSATEDAGYAVVAVGDGLAAARELRCGHFDAVLLDIGLPLVDGWHILAELQDLHVPPVIVISARGDERDKVRALDIGADDYLAKPFGSEELLARLRAVLRRARPPAEPSRIVEVGDVTVDLGGRSVFRGGEEVRLSPTELALVVELARHAGRVVDHRSLLRRVWGPEYAGERNYLRTFVQRLRAKLEPDPAAPRLIVTVDRQGYRFGPPAPPRGPASMVTPSQAG